MAPRKMAKAAGESTSQNTNVLSDTSPRVVDTMKTWMQVFDILQYEMINYLEESRYEVTETQAMNLKYIAQSELHKIAMWLRLMVYNDIIGWALENIDISTRHIHNS
jgi:hypothetical protein